MGTAAKLEDRSPKPMCFQSMPFPSVRRLRVPRPQPALEVCEALSCTSCCEETTSARRVGVTQGIPVLALVHNPTLTCAVADSMGCTEMQVDPGDIVMLVLSWHFRAVTMCEYSREEFVSGMLRLRCDSLPKLQQKLPELRRDLQDPQKYKASSLLRDLSCFKLF